MGEKLFRYTLATHAWLINFVRGSFILSFFWPYIDTWLLLMVDLCRLFSGRKCATGLDQCKRPKEPLILYQFESCPFCRKVRETLSVLAIDHYVYPCPRETLKQRGLCVNSRYRPEVMKLGGRLAFPFLVDPNSNKKMYESGDIIKYLWSEYGAAAKSPLNYRLAHTEPFQSISMKLCALMRPCMDMGILRSGSHKPEIPLQLTGYEGSCLVRRVRELLDTLELPYLYHEIPMGLNSKREAFYKQHEDKLCCPKLKQLLGLVEVPYLKDPNTKVELFTSRKILNYLKKTYLTAPPPLECWTEYGINDAQKTK